jgi:OOP family OmpA-OmpF porin
MSQLEPNTNQVAGTTLSESESSGMSGTVGYDFANRFSVEGHYAELGEAELAPAGTVGYSVAGVSALYYGMNHSVDRSSRTGLSAYGRLGLGMLENEVTVVEYRRINDLHLLAGVGLEYGLNNGFAVRGEVTAHETDAKYAQLGLIYRFTGAGRSAPAETLSEVVAKDVEPVFAPAPKMPSDTDADGVADLMDSCPTTRRGLPVKPDGCAIFEGVIEGINFETNSDLLTADSLIILEGVAETLAEYPDVRVTIEAHADNLGTATSNLQLSKRRAISVARYLVEKGILGSRLKPQAFGESVPRISNASKKGRAANRRVEFSVL